MNNLNNSNNSNNSKNCNNCAWYCHGNSKCYGNAINDELAIQVDPWQVCSAWAYDGLDDWERDELDALVTMDTVSITL